MAPLRRLVFALLCALLLSMAAVRASDPVPENQPAPDPCDNCHEWWCVIVGCWP